VKNLKIRSALPVCLAIMALLFALSSACFAAGGIGVTVNGNALTLDQPPVSIGGRVLVPLRGIFESLGASVSWNAASQSIDARRGTTVVHLTLNSSSAIVNGSAVALDVPAQAINGRTLVPLRFVSETLGASVTWDAASRTVAVMAGSAPSVTIQPPPTVVIAPLPRPAQPSIESVTIDKAGPLHPGNVLNAVVIGTPEATTTLEIRGLTASIPMSETTAGRYEAHFTIPPSLPLSSNSFAVLAHMTLNGMEDTRECTTPLALSGADGNVFVRVTSPTRHERVTSDFILTGNTVPFATVDVRCSNHVRATGEADANGHFAIPLHLGFDHGRHHASMEVTATDRYGRVSKKAHYEIAVGD